MLLRCYLNKRPSVHAELTTWHATESVSLTCIQLLTGLVIARTAFHL